MSLSHVQLALLAKRFADLDVFLSMDHSQLEIRILAQMSRDPLLMKLFREAKADIHSMVGHELTGTSVEKIKKDRDTRTLIKGLHFGIIYGLSPWGLYSKLKFEWETDKKNKGQPFPKTAKDIEKLYETYFRRFIGAKKFIDSRIEYAEQHGMIRSLFGFRREITPSGDEERTTFWKNQAVNTPVQSSAHTLVLIAMALLKLKPKTYNLLLRPTMEIHDSLVWFSKLRDLAASYMQGTKLLQAGVLEYIKRWWPQVDWQVPLVVEAKAGLRYGVLVEDYTGWPAEEFLEKWCAKNLDFEKEMRGQMRKELHQ